MELMGALLSVRAIQMFVSKLSDLRSVPVYFWTDSTCVLAWVQTTPEILPRFVQNRVKEIQGTAGTWMYVPGEANPADLATRGASLAVLESSNLWRQGPDWLPDSTEWPPRPSVAVPQPPEAVACPVVAETPEIDKFCSVASDLRTLEFYAACWLRFGHNAMLTGNQRAQRKVGPLRYIDRLLALEALIGQVQNTYYPEEIVCLKRDTDRGVPVHSKLRRLRPFLDADNMLLYGLPRTGELPVLILPPEAQLTRLIVWDIHHRLFHAGVDRVITEVQRRYWVPQLRRMVRNLLPKCTRCTRYQGRPYGSPEGFLAPLRTRDVRPFAHTGLDYVGPLTVSPGVKAYILLFTCACIRAVHLEVTRDQSTHSTERAIRRFIARRGQPDVIYSDNALSFRQVGSLLSVPWRPIPECSPWWGGWWERLVGTVKQSLRKTIHLSSLNMEELSTVACEIESAINRRPLTYVSDAPDSVAPLKPCDFLSISAPLCSPWAADTGRVLGARFRHRKVVASRLMTRWRQEYLTSLRGWRGSLTRGKAPSVGDIVLVKEGSRRALWPLAKIVELLGGSDGVTRAAIILLNGNRTRRAISLLYPLEAEPPWSGLPTLHSRTESSSDSSPSDSEDAEAAEPTPSTSVTRGGRQVRLPARFQ